MQDRFPELMAWLERHPVSYTVLTLAALITLAWLADWLTKHILLRSVNRVLKSTSLADDPEVRALRVISRLAHVVPALVLTWGIQAVPELPEAVVTVVAAAPNAGCARVPELATEIRDSGMESGPEVSAAPAEERFTLPMLD